MKIKLRGIAEGVVGLSEVKARNTDEVFEQHPELEKVKDKLAVQKNSISGYAPCDG